MILAEFCCKILIHTPHWSYLYLPVSSPFSAHVHLLPCSTLQLPIFALPAISTVQPGYLFQSPISHSSVIHNNIPLSICILCYSLFHFMFHLTYLCTFHHLHFYCNIAIAISQEIIPCHPPCCHLIPMLPVATCCWTTCYRFPTNPSIYALAFTLPVPYIIALPCHLTASYPPSSSTISLLSPSCTLTVAKCSIHLQFNLTKTPTCTYMLPPLH